eukprot:3789984-Prymnesium_polylepis.1
MQPLDRTRCSEPPPKGERHASPRRGRSPGSLWRDEARREPAGRSRHERGVAPCASQGPRCPRAGGRARRAFRDASGFWSRVPTTRTTEAPVRRMEAVEHHRTRNASTAVSYTHLTLPTICSV